jgi:hypothetical protein
MRGIDQEAWYGAAVPGVAEPRQGDAGAVRPGSVRRVQARPGLLGRDGKGRGTHEP